MQGKCSTSISPFIKLLKQHYYQAFLIILVLASFVLRFVLQSPYLDEWDSVRFVLALTEYSIPLHQPHPPGYPVYIFLGRCAYFFLKNGQTAFIFLSVLFGSLSLIPTYYLGKNLFNEKIGILSALILSLTPAALLFSEVVMSDIVSMFFIVTSLCLLYLGIEKAEYLYLGSFILGITLGVRQSDFLLLPLFILVLYYVRDLKKVLISSFFALIGIIIWLLPVLIITGPDTYFQFLETQSQFAYSHTTLASYGGPGLINVVRTFSSFTNLFIEGWSLSVLLFVLTAAIIIVYTLSNAGNYHIDKRTLFLVLWILPYFAYFIFFIELYITRYILPIFPALAIIFSYFLITAINMVPRKICKICLLIIFSLAIGFMGYQAMTLAYNIHTIPPAPVKSAYFIREHYDPENTIVFAHTSQGHYQYYIPEYNARFSQELTYLEAYQFLIENKTVLSELDLGVYPSRPFIFSRDSTIYPKHQYVQFFEYHLDENEIHTLFGDGWYPPDFWRSVPTYWMKANASLLVYSDREQNITVNFWAISAIRPRTLEISKENLSIIKLTVLDNCLTEVNIPLALSKGQNTANFSIQEGCESPSEVKELRNPDSRCLSIAIQNLTIVHH